MIYTDDILKKIASANNYTGGSTVMPMEFVDFQ